MSITDRRWMCWYFLTGWLPICGPGCSGPPDPAGGATEPAGGATSTDAAPPDLPSPTPTPTTGDGTTGDTTTTGALATTGVATTTDDASTTGGDVCGDGVVGPAEACDLGPDNRDDGPCTLDCEVAVCGDGKVWAEAEECDLGGDNGDDFGGCGVDCTLNPRCGDGILDPSEQCDAGALNGTGESPDATLACTVGCRWDARLAFLSSAKFTADLGGLDGADLQCRNMAKAAGLPAWETYRAWLSDGATGPLERFTLSPARPYGLPNGVRIADDLGDLVLNGPGEGIRVDELGTPLPPSLVWTNTSVAGAPYSATDHCNHWSGMAPTSARVGTSHVAMEPQDAWQQWHADLQWTSALALKCHQPARLYCFEN